MVIGGYMTERKKFELNKGGFFQSMHSRKNKDMAKKHNASVKARKKSMQKKKDKIQFSYGLLR